MEKWATGTFERLYAFCPLDLFSGELKRMSAALNALIDEPHRNFRLLVDGKLVHHGAQIATRNELAAIINAAAATSLQTVVRAVRLGADCAPKLWRLALLHTRRRSQRCDG